MARRQPGRATDKLRLLRKVGAKEFPWLVADVLAIDMGHANVRVTEGPGDGRRDIFSQDNKEQRVVTQCKFTSKKTVGSRATDEIAIALNKFGVKSGIVATNGLLSPQAKRELLDNFPGFSVGFLEGPDLVDAILGDTDLRKAWFDGEAIGRRFREIVVPMFGVDLLTDRAVLLELRGEGIQTQTVATSLLKPFRPPSSGGMFSGHGDLVRCTIFRRTVEALSEWIHVAQAAEEKLSTCGQRGIAVRLGSPSWIVGEDLVSSVKLADPRTVYVLESEIISEAAWLMPIIDGALYPDGYSIRSSNVEWARLYHPASDLLIGLEVDSPPDAKLKEIGELLWRTDVDLLAKSIFVFMRGDMPEKERHAFEDILGEFPPNHEQILSSTVKLIGWLHPLLSEGGWSLHLVGADIEEPPDVPALRVIRERLRAADVEIIDEAIATNLVGPRLRSRRPVERTTYGLAQIAYYYNEFPSPMRIEGRRFTFERVWVVESEGPTESDLPVWSSGLQGAATHAYLVDVEDKSASYTALVARLELEPKSLASSTAWIQANVLAVAQDLDEFEARAAKILRLRRDTRRIWEGVSGLHFKDFT